MHARSAHQMVAGAEDSYIPRSLVHDRRIGSLPVWDRVATDICAHGATTWSTWVYLHKYRYCTRYSARATKRPDGQGLTDQISGT